MYFRDSPYRGNLDQCLAHPAGDGEFLIVAGHTVGSARPVVQCVLVDFGDLIGPVQLGKSGGRNEIPRVAGQVWMAADRGKKCRRDNRGEGHA